MNPIKRSLYFIVFLLLVGVGLATASVVLNSNNVSITPVAGGFKCIMDNITIAFFCCSYWSYKTKVKATSLVKF